MSESQLVKVGVNFPVFGEAERVCLEYNRTIRALTPSHVAFAEGGNSSPHVTLSMGLVPVPVLNRLATHVREYVRSLPAEVVASFGMPYREDLTGRYVMCDVDFAPDVLEWRLAMRGELATEYSESARSSETPHLTIGHILDHQSEVDLLLDGFAPIPSCKFMQVDISLAGSKGTKGRVLEAIALD